MRPIDILPEGVTREVMEVDILIVGGGSAGLSAALHLANKIEEHNQLVAEGKKKEALIPEQMIVVLEKGQEIGSHSLSGAVINTTSLSELVPNYKEQGCPIEAEVNYDAVHFLTEDTEYKLPLTPPSFHNLGNSIVSISKLNKWLGARCESKGINIFPGFAAVEALYEGTKIIGVRTGDKGRNQDGAPRSNFEPGLIIKSKLTIFAEGTRGSLFKKVSEKLNLRAGKNSEVFEEGVKEIIQMPKGTVDPGQVIHTMGYPLSKSIGGSFFYTMADDKIALGLVAYLDSVDPLLDPHRELQKLKSHPFIYNKIKGGKVIAYGAKTLPAGGWYSIPQLYGDGWLVVGDSASFVDVKKLKGVHLSIKSGMLAAEAVLSSLLVSDYSAHVLKNYKEKIDKSFIKEELFLVRNFHQALSKGMLAALPLIALQEITGGKGFCDPMKAHEDSRTTEPAIEVWGSEGRNHSANQLPKTDGILFFDKLSSVYLTGTLHDEHSPNHLILKNSDICSGLCEPKYKAPCTFFCPAAVYEMIPQSDKSNVSSAPSSLQINYTNCIHCKTCDIKCPFENIEWTTPEGGGGPRYSET